MLFAGCLLFSVSGRLNEGIYFGQHILSAVSDHYYLTYFFASGFTVSLLFPFWRMTGKCDFAFSKLSFYFIENGWEQGDCPLLIAAQSAAVLYPAWGFPGNGWELPEGAAGAELFLCCGSIFPPPVQAFAAFSACQFSEAG